MGESHATEDAEVAALRCAFEIGYRLIDTAEMSGEGGAERVLGRAIEDALSDGAFTTARTASRSLPSTRSSASTGGLQDAAPWRRRNAYNAALTSRAFLRGN